MTKNRINAVLKVCWIVGGIVAAALAVSTICLANGISAAGILILPAAIYFAISPAMLVLSCIAFFISRAEGDKKGRTKALISTVVYLALTIAIYCILYWGGSV